MRVELIVDDDRLFESGRRLTLQNATGRLDEEIEFFRRQHGRCVLKMRGIDSISDAEFWIGAEIRIPIQEIGPLESGWFYTFQLKGCRVLTAGGEYLGIVTDVLDSGGTEILKVEREKEETLIPFAQSYLKRIDLGQQLIEVDLPEGLRELNK